MYPRSILYHPELARASTTPIPSSSFSSSSASTTATTSTTPPRVSLFEPLLSSVATMSRWIKPSSVAANPSPTTTATTANTSNNTNTSPTAGHGVPATAAQSPLTTGQCPFGFTSEAQSGTAPTAPVFHAIARPYERSDDKVVEALTHPPSASTSESLTEDKTHTTAAVVGDGRALTYWEYLQLERLLALNPAVLHGGEDEQLFIAVHQVFELQFKVVISDLHLVLRLLAPTAAASSTSSATLLNSLVTACRFLHRSAALLSWSVSGFEALGLLSAVSFLEFRDHLGSASGFQSLQFRQLEALLGVTDVIRPNTAYRAALKEERVKLDRYREEQPVSLETALYSWLRGLDIPRLDEFKAAYLAVHTPPPSDHDSADDAQRALTASLLHRQSGYAAWLSDTEHGGSRLAALYVLTYRGEATWHVHADVVEGALEMEAALLTWRQQHVRLVEKMIGSKVGTAASSGVGYLRATTGAQQRLFADLHQVRTMMAAPSKIRFQP